VTSSPPEVLRSDPFPPITRLTLALYCGASGDHNPLHVDIDAARAAGFDDVIAHGMLPMAYLAQFLGRHFEQSRLRRLQVRFSAMTRVGDVLVCTAERVPEPDAVSAPGQGDVVTYAVSVVDQGGETKMSGVAEILPRP
jgi:acyl dehydratase